MTRIRRLTPAAALCGWLAVAPAGAQSTDPAWLEQLNTQAAELQQCEVAYIVRLREGELGGREFYEARIKCMDGRMFDATRIGRHGFFEFKACEVQVC